jgi:hypothetical protein
MITHAAGNPANSRGPPRFKILCNLFSTSASNVQSRLRAFSLPVGNPFGRQFRFSE